MAIASASLVRRDRDRQAYQAYYEEDMVNIAPKVLRRSLLRYQRSGTYQAIAQTSRCPIPTNVVEESRGVMSKTSEDVQGVPIQASGKVTPLRTRRTMREVSQLTPLKVDKAILISLIILGVIVVVGMVKFILFVGDLWIDYNNTLTYGPTRTSVITGIFGHNDSPSHPTNVVVLNINGVIDIQALPGGDPSKAKTYSTGYTLVGDSAAKTPIVLTIKDLNHDGKPDVLVQVVGQHITFKLINVGSDFQFVK